MTFAVVSNFRVKQDDGVACRFIEGYCILGISWMARKCPEDDNFNASRASGYLSPGFEHRLVNLQVL